MSEIVVYIENELEWIRVTNLLKDSDFPYNANKVSDATFPSLSQADKYEIVISANDYDDFLKLVGKVYPIKRIDPEPAAPQPRTSRFKTALVLYSLIMTILFVKYFYIERSNSTDKNFEYEWSLDNSKLTISHKKTGDLSAIYYDTNYDLNYEKVVAYHKGTKTSASFDKDEDGQIEHEVVYDKTGRIIGVNTDYDGDGFFDYGLMLLENGDSLEFMDQNKNGVFQLKD